MVSIKRQYFKGGIKILSELLTIGLIVKNEEEMLKKTLAHLADLKIPIIVLDTGSTDQTKPYLKSLNVEVDTLENWNKDFSVARNKLLSKVRTPWFLTLDADEYIAKESIEKIKGTILNSDKTFYYLPIYQNLWLAKETDTEKYFRIKLFRTDQGYQYHRPVNEDLNIPSKMEPDYFLDVPIYHWGNDTLSNPDKYKQKIKNYIDLFQSAIAKPDYQKDAMLHFQLARHLDSLHREKEAFTYFLKAAFFASKSNKEHRFTKLLYYYELIKRLKNQKRYQRTVKLLLAMEKKFQLLNKALYLELGIAYFNLSNWQEAEQALLKSMSYTNPAEEKFTCYPFETKGFHQSLYLGLAEEKLGHIEQAYQCMIYARNIAMDPIVTESIARIEKIRRDARLASGV